MQIIPRAIMLIDDNCVKGKMEMKKAPGGEPRGLGCCANFGQLQKQGTCPHRY
jgi:hypothetical protein